MSRNIFKVFYFIFTTILLSILFVECKREAPKLIDDDSGRQLKQVSECQFGKTIRELGSSWFADLGPPFGVMYCIKCECVPVTKKKRVVARVQCKNIKNECPPANCDDPVLLPGKCCKSCPGDNNTEMVQDQDLAPSNTEEEERNMKHFAALLTGRTSHFLKKEDTTTSYSKHNTKNLIATGRFNFQKKNLYYSFYVSSNKQMGRPTTIQFFNDVGTILEEHNLTTSTNGPLSIYEKSTGKICGVWRRIPKDYKRLLRDGRLHVVLLWRSTLADQVEFAIGGKVDIYKALYSELFSTLLEPSQSPIMNGAGGTAIISTTTGAASSVHLTFVFNGIFMPDDQIDIPVNIRIENPERKEIILEEVQKVHKPQTDINTLEISSPISIQNLRSLSRGKLLLTIESKRYPNLKLQGQIVTRTSCEMFQTLMTPPNYESRTKTSGLAWMYLNTDGSLIYNIQTDQLDLTESPELRLIDDNGKNKILEDLTKSLNHNQAVGTIDKLAPRVLESLYSGDLAVNVATPNETTLVKGRFISRPVADARDSAEPILLKRRDMHSPANFMGLAWLAVDNDCNLHYDISLNGYSSDKQIFQIYLEEKPIDVLGAPTTRKLLEEFSGSSIEGFNFDMSKSDILKLESSVCYLEIYSKDKKELLLRGKLKSTKVPNHCHPIYDDNNIPSVISLGDGTISISPQSKCYHSKKFYDESEQWKSSDDQCTMCSCQGGQAICELIKCPVVNCKVGEHLVLRDGECCKVCVGENTDYNVTTKGCKLGDQFHLAGSSWHPYLPPNGFDTCTTCTCDIFNLSVRCSRMACPKLSCPEKLAYRPDKKACCKVCPVGKPSHTSIKPTPDNPNVLRDEGTKTDIVKTPEEILSQGGCKAVNYLYENGQEWHPILASHGEQKCIKCRCKDGKVSCDRKRCSRSCNNSNGLTTGNRRKQNTTTDSDCCPNCRRHRRHQGTKRFHRDRNDGKIMKSTNSNRS